MGFFFLISTVNELDKFCDLSAKHCNACWTLVRPGLGTVEHGGFPVRKRQNPVDLEVDTAEKDHVSLD